MGGKSLGELAREQRGTVKGRDGGRGGGPGGREGGWSRSERRSEGAGIEHARAAEADPPQIMLVA
jgi:hypothetical protein